LYEKCQRDNYFHTGKTPPYNALALAKGAWIEAAGEMHGNRIRVIHRGQMRRMERQD
jgi:hypothetical protein